MKAKKVAAVKKSAMKIKVAVATSRPRAKTIEVVVKAPLKTTRRKSKTPVAPSRKVR